MTDRPQSREFRAATAEETRALGARIATLLGPGDLVVLAGPLGAGKTTLVQGLAEGLKVRGPITSPTFVIARVHPSLSGGPALVHADAYRIGGALEIDDLDLDASLAESVTVVEWGEGLVEGLSEDRLEILIKRFEGEERPAAGVPADAEERVIRLTPIGPRWSTTSLTHP
ncbi:tRNA (adenosine(37)-N6)-threonylcarbamoyltransferase complex ATPase subunit type 1 TsaE [Sphaerimonospora thailandensis]|uniref:tRNA threonylcarbamoyladenosine biosynthesis protein TsaE n=1 Tax=Sphaerimonospora thailandensis TaxID=795644 RepID=A0A8J3R5X5_9ACTN|nr:tRNA (adenosine(37)-N6)-threonylcarbamoyltransferase complex ATPase subunit type 1 TsaE [Sphaerimonospora thailandensis]GIH69697.1 tRNA threonylcarbamoyladenosine biosynthesis protein TsaE [Sphaerimonospora thailandensis]